MFKKLLFVVATLAISLTAVTDSLAQAPGVPGAPVAAPAPVKIPVNSPAFVFSPGNWTGDTGRAGAAFRQTWNSGAYFRVYWTTTSNAPVATLTLDTSSYDGKFGPPQLTYNVDGLWTANIPAKSDINIAKLAGTGSHVLTVYFTTSEQRERWGSPGTSGKNVLRVTGLNVDEGSKPGTAVAGKKWMLEIGDSITEGSGAGEGRLTTFPLTLIS